MVRDADPAPSVVENVERAAAKGVGSRRRQPLSITETFDTTAVLVALSLATAALATVRWFARRSR